MDGEFPEIHRSKFELDPCGYRGPKPAITAGRAAERCLRALTAILGFVDSLKLA